MAQHEVWQVYPVVTLDGIGIGEDLVIDEVDTKGIGDDDDNTLYRSALSWFSNVGFEAMELDHVAPGCTIMLVAGEAVWTRHIEILCSPLCTCAGDKQSRMSKARLILTIDVPYFMNDVVVTPAAVVVHFEPDPTCTLMKGAGSDSTGKLKRGLSPSAYHTCKMWCVDWLVSIIRAV